MIAASSKWRVPFIQGLLGTILVVLSWTTGSLAWGQLTTEQLIGSAVSLSNQQYPEIDKAIQRFSNSDAKGALEYLKIAKEKYPKLPPTDVTFAKMHMAARNARGVHILLERAVTEHPDDPEAYLILADQAFRGNRTTEAQGLFELAAPLVENFSGNSKRKRNFNISVIAGRTAIAERRAQWDTAYQLLKKWVEFDPDSSLAHTRLGVTLFRLEKAKEALEELIHAHKLNPDMSHPYVSLGQLFTQAGNIQNARKSYEKAYNEDKSDLKTAQSYADWLIVQNELDKAREVATALREQSPDSPKALLLDGIVSYMQGEEERTEQTLQKVLTLDPRNARANDLLALLLIQSDKVSDQERALSYANNNADQLPNNSQALITKAWVLYRLGHKAEAQAALQQGAKNQLQADSTYLIAKIMLEEGQKEKAMQALEQIANQKAGLRIFRREAEELLKELKSESP